MSPDRSPSRPVTRVTVEAPAAVVGRYQILERIGEGGMGALFLARDPIIERLVAIKVLRQGHNDPALRERFLREGRAAGRLRHPNIVTIFDVGEHNGDPFIAMEFLAGETLADLIRQGARLALSRRLRLLEDLCDGLAYAHRAGLVHRDIKPANLMVDADGSLKILDFGIVRVGESGMTEAGSLVGTINYMSPEQVSGEPVDYRSDIFAVGLVAYEFISSRQAFPGALSEGLFQRITAVAVDPLTSVCPTLDPAVAGIVNQALQRDPAARYQDLARMRNDLATTRQRLEAEEERAAAAATSDVGETAIVPTPVPSSIGPGGTVPLPPTVAHTPPALADAEHALATGNYRAALKLAGRSTIEGAARHEATSIVQRANSALLEQGRRLEQMATSAAPATPAPATGTVSPASNWIAIGVAVVALMAAGAAIFMRDRTPAAGPPAVVTTPSNPSPAPETKPEPIAGTPGQGPVAPTGAPAPPPPSVTPPRDTQTRTVPAPPPDRPRGPDPGAKPAEPRPRPPVVPLRVGSGGIEAPRRTRHVEPVYPAAALGAGIHGTVELELTINADGDVTDTLVTRSVPQLDRAAQRAAMQWEYAPTIVAGAAVPVIHTVQIAFVLPTQEASAPPREAPVPQPGQPLPGPVTPPSRPPVSEPRPPAPPDPRADEVAIRQQLHSYEAAWRALDVAALGRVQQLSPADLNNVRRTMADAEAYEVAIAVDSVKVDGSRAEVRAQVARRFQPKTGRQRATSVMQTIDLERQGERWMIVRFR